ncbi:MAG: efflux RND transporter permease subunit, partial [Spirochaetia bacterium]|nr:efflux RND transporter permease subunit [Spirochaetia bacterium]
EYRLQALGISLDQLSQAVSASNFSYPAGNVKRGSREYTVRVMGEFNSTDDIRNVVLSTGENGAPVKLSQVARVWDGFAERRGATLHNGTEAVIVGIRKEPGKNTIETAQSIRGALTDINRRFAESLEFEIIQDQSVFVQNAVDNLALDALFGGLLAFLVLLVFLRDIRAALIVAVTLPVSVIATFVPMYVRGVSLNIMSLGGLSLGLGMLIDNSIVVVESILSERELQPGLGLRETAVAGTRKVAASVVASTLASAVVFVPILFVSGLAGEVFRDMALTVTLSSVSSFLCSLSLIPMLTTIEPSSGGFTARVFAYVDATLGPVFHVADMAVQALSVFYAQTISLALSRPLATSSVAVLLTLSGAALFLPVKKAIFPDTDQGIVSVEMDMPGGISVEEAASVHRKIHDFISDNRLAVHSLTEIGFEGGDLSSRVKGLRKASHAESVFYLPSGTSSADFIRILRPALERSVRADVRPRSKGDPLQELVRESNAMLSLSIEGQDREALRSAAERVHKEMANLGVPTGLQIVSTAVAADPEVRIELDRVRAAAFGLTPETIAGVVRSAVNGTVSTIFRDGDQEVAVRVLLRDDDKRRVDQLGALHVTSPAGNVRLAGLIRSTEGKSYPALLREDQRSLERLQFSFPASQQHTVRRALDEAAFRLARDLEGHGNTERRPEVRISEENQETIESLSNLLVAFGLSGILIYMLLAAQFESLLHPLTLAAAIPMMLLGVSAALLLTGHSLNITSATGMI